MANYDVYKRIGCPVYEYDSGADLSHKFPSTEPLKVVEFDIIEWSVGTHASEFDFSKVTNPVSNVATVENFGGYNTALAALSPNIATVNPKTGTFATISAIGGTGIFVNGKLVSLTGGFGPSYQWTLVYDPSRNVTAMVSSMGYLAFTYADGSYAGELYSFTEYAPDDRKAVNFYRTKDGEYTGEPITLNRGESSGRLTFDIVFSDDTVFPYSGEVLFEPPSNNDFSVEINSITALETATRYETTIIAKPALYPEVFTLIKLLIPDNLGPYGPGGTSGPGGGDGTFGDGDSEDIRGDVPNGSKESNSSSTGLFTRYAMSSSDLYVVGAALYTENILASIGKEIMSFLWNSPSDALISLISYPFDVSSLISTTSTSVKFGSLNLEAVSGARLNGTFAQIDWGSIQLEEFWGNFLDYAPHTKIELYLPWCTGFVSIDPHECLPGSISVVTNIEISKGTCVHNVFGNKGALIGTYSGTCGSQLPMTALDTSGKALALVTAAAGALVAGAAAGGATSAGIAAANDVHAWGPYQKQAISRGLEYRAAHLWAVDKAAEAAEAPYRAVKQRASQAALVSAAAAFRTPASVQRSGSFSGNGAGMGIQYPFIIISRPEQNVPENYGRFYGYPSNVYTSLGSIRGYTEVGSVHVNGLSGATLEEIEEVENLLHGGVIL